MRVPLYTVVNHIRIIVGEAMLDSNHDKVWYVEFNHEQTELTAIFAGKWLDKDGFSPVFKIETNETSGLMEVTMSLPEGIFMQDDTLFDLQRTQDSFQTLARKIVFNHVKTRLEKTDTHVTFRPDDVYVVWSCKTLQNWKCLLSTTLPDGMYYELTYNGDKQECYLDAYKKFENVVIPLPELY